MATQGQQMSELDFLRQQLWEVVKEVVQNNDLSIALSCEYKIKEFIYEGILKLQNQNNGELKNEDRETTEQNLKIFIYEMISFTKANGELELYETSFYSIKDKICPLFPFC